MRFVRWLMLCALCVGLCGCPILPRKTVVEPQPGPQCGNLGRRYDVPPPGPLQAPRGAPAAPAPVPGPEGEP